MDIHLGGRPSLRRVRLKLALFSVTLICLASVIGCTKAAPTPQPTPAPPAPPSVGYYPPETRTGIPQLDSVIDATMKKDQARLGELVALVNVPCVSPGEIGYPPCPAGTTNQTPVPVFHRNTCSVNFLFDLTEAKAEVQAKFTQSLHLHSVYRKPEAAGKVAYAIVFVPDDLKSSKTLYVNESGKVYGEHLGCASEIDKGGEYILAPSK